ncbi:MAG: dicarboxylate/amino acid:cation symporter [Rickettsiales bacterium]|nr:dicarboxylate/amino acid:cation symporter [Rickettsiales bacterium]|tara:strand:+ start:6863 stop:8083 length:1221 start_codon:yes stop_codon:yes gene_type:complete
MNFKLPTQIMFAMLLGVIVGILFREHALIFEPLGNVFIRLLKMIIVPIIFSSLVVGVVSLGSVQSLGRLGMRTFLYYMVTTIMAVMIGLIVVNFIKPGFDTDVDLALFSSNPITDSIDHDVSVVSVITDIVPSNIISAIATENMLGIIFFSIIFGTALLSLDIKGGTVKQFIEEFNNLFLKITDWIMKLSPIGVFALIATMVGQTGFAIFKPVAFYVATVLIAIAIHLLFTLSSILIIVARYSPVTFFQKIFPAIATAFSTDSSIATLPVTMECLEKNVGVSKKVVGFIAPLGATVNMDGTALYEAVAAVFIAQVVGIDMTITQQIIVMLTAVLASVGAAGIPSAGLVTMVIVLKSVNLPLEGIGILLAVDRILDMFRTSVNIISDSCGALVIGRLEGEQFAAEEY